MNELIDKARESLADSSLIDSKSPLLLMVSGGSDSVALLHLCTTLCLSHPLQVLHVNHQLRGAEADADEQFVRALCATLGVACETKQVDIASLAAEAHESVEQTGRRIRYQLADEVLDLFCKKSGVPAEAGRILTAHTADDRAETLLQRIIVGGGGGSLASIPKRNGRVVRPLLMCKRQELRDWLNSLQRGVQGELWREDSSNLDTEFSRSFVRHELLPLLANRNPRIIEGLNRTADVLSDESNWLDELAATLVPLTDASFAAPLPLLRRAVYLACNQAIAELSPGARITFEHIELIAKQGSKKGFACQIPGGIEIRNTGNLIEFKKAKPPRHDPRV